MKRKVEWPATHRADWAENNSSLKYKEAAAMPKKCSQAHAARITRWWQVEISWQAMKLLKNKSPDEAFLRFVLSTQPKIKGNL